MNRSLRVPDRALLAALLALAAALPACAPLVFGGAVAGSMVAIDRRTSGTQLEDETIELKAINRVKDLATLGNVSVTSYNRLVLITGEVPTEADVQRVGSALERVENVKAVVNELAVGPNASLGTKSNDSLISARVKAALVDAKDMQANAVKVVTERGIVYLMGMVTEREAARAAEIARAQSGVQKVVRVFEVMSEAELNNLLQPPKKAGEGAAPARP